MAESTIPVEAEQAAIRVAGIHGAMAVQAAAPHIARAARIDELKRLLGEQEQAIIGWALDPSMVVDVDDIEARIAELEADDA